MTERSRGMFSAKSDAYLGYEPELGVQELAPGVWTATDGEYRTLFADGDDHVVALNTLGTPGRARAYRRAIESTVPGKPIGTLVMTIDHLDHAGFATELAPDADVIAHELCAQVARGRGSDGQRAPTQAIAGSGEELEVGGLRLTLNYPGPTVGTGNLAVEIGETGITFLVGPRADARYGLFPDFHMRHYSDSVRRLLDRGFDQLVPGRSTPMTPEQVGTALEYFDALHEASQRAFAEGVPIWEYEAMRAYVEESLRDRFASLQGFERHVGIGAIRVVHHYLMGGWGIEDTTRPDRVLTG